MQSTVCIRNEQQRRPTEGELDILRVLWDVGPRTVRDIQKILNEVRPTGYTTVLKLLQIMTEKGAGGARREVPAADLPGTLLAGADAAAIGARSAGSRVRRVGEDHGAAGAGYAEVVGRGIGSHGDAAGSIRRRAEMMAMSR